MKFSLVITIVLGIVCSPAGVSSRKCFVQICSKNPSNRIRGRDAYGSGAWGASRGSRTHKGIDILCTVRSSVYTPFPAKVLRRSNPYLNNNAAYNTGIYLEGTGSWSGYKVKMWYVTKQVSNGKQLSAGSYIGSMTDRTIDARGSAVHPLVQMTALEQEWKIKIKPALSRFLFL
ncbi:Peptidase M23 [Desmophyllum pertusum]|uniref:Peptidase M23 n=1 Tax=Desmophyllum pertusum TaxID=174260 RepID=A0A9W9YNU7_9CNID|nr:Peptidase M23 [Desmophyllum pertusum]